jgi:hypothetical protein
MGKDKKRRPSGHRSDNKRGPIYVLDPMAMSTVESKESRDAAFDALGGYAIPENLIEAVRCYRQYATVRWVKDKTTNVTAPVVKPSNKDKEYLARAIESCDLDGSDQLPTTAGDALAKYLRLNLMDLRPKKNAPVRLGRMLARSAIATVAISILDIGRLFGRLPSRELVDLLRELLDADKTKHSADRQFVARHHAAWILAQDSDFPTRNLARSLGVNASSVSRWRRDSLFQKEIQRIQGDIAEFEKHDSWPPESAIDQEIWSAAAGKPKGTIAGMAHITDHARSAVDAMLQISRRGESGKALELVAALNDIAIKEAWGATSPTLRSRRRRRAV